MITWLIDDPPDLNDVSVQILNYLKKIDILELHRDAYLINIENVVSRRLHIAVNSERFESDRKNIEDVFLSFLRYIVLNYSLTIDQLKDEIILNDYFYKKDLNDLILTSICLEILQRSYLYSVEYRDQMRTFISDLKPEVYSFFWKYR